jgi:N-methylhydantoinase A
LDYRVAIDIGGTFTDLIAEEAGGRGLVSSTKVLSTPGRLVDGVVGAVRACGVPASEMSLFVHGTTAGLNAFLERRGAKVALVTTRGFRDTYLIGRGHRPQMYDLHYRKPRPLLERSAIFEIDERVAADGSELTPIDEASVEDVADAIREGGFEALAVCLLHAYASPEHERVVGGLLERATGLPVVLSHAVAPVWREYERTSTTVMSAYITPIMKRYLDEVQSALGREGLSVPVHITESNGGVMGANVAADKAIVTLFSGPVGGVVGARAAGAALGYPDLITIDIGGTSFDVSLVRDGEAAEQSEFELQGLPMLSPAVEVHTIGAGGGSLIREVHGALRVGPESAGAHPGPACYGLGGTEPTVTDANLVLGRIPSEQLLAGAMSLDLEAAREALASVGERFGLSAEALAEQALEIVHFSMAEAIRELTVERGLDPSDFVLCAFGGAGGLHATALAEELGILAILIPTNPGAFSAWGMLKGDLRHDGVSTFYRDLERGVGDLPDAVRGIEGQVTELLQLDGATTDGVRFECAADLRYVGQEYTLTLPLLSSETRAGAAPARAIASRFHEAYGARYGHASPSEPLEFVALRVAGISELERPSADTTEADGDGASAGRAPMHHDGRLVEAALFRRAAIGAAIEGPAIVLEDTCTTVVSPGWSVRPVPGGHLLLEKD